MTAEPQAAVSLTELLGLVDDAGSTGFAFGPDLLGAFGGVFGGVIAAGAIVLARRTAPERIPAGIDCHFVRALPPGRAEASVEVVHAGRVLSCVRVDLFDERGRLTTSSTVSLIEPEALHPLDLTPEHGASGAAVAGGPRPWSSPAGIDVPIVHLLRPQLTAGDDGSISTAVEVPWSDPGTSAEAACLAADFCVGPPVARACEGAWLPHPNPDLSLHLTPLAAVPRQVVGTGRLVRAVGGLTVVDVTVSAGGVDFCAGSATSMILRGKER